MHCIKCGRTIPENTVFCTGCAAPPAPVVPVTLPKNTAAEPAVKRRKKPRKKWNYRRIVRRLSIAVTVLSLLLVGLSVFVGRQAQLHRQRKEDLRIREASVVLREKEADNRDAQIKSLEEQLRKATAELEEARQALEALQPAP